MNDVRISFMFKVTFRRGVLTARMLKGGVLRQNALDTTLNGRCYVLSDKLSPPTTMKMLLLLHGQRYDELLLKNNRLHSNRNTRDSSRPDLVVERYVKVWRVRINQQQDISIFGALMHPC